MTNSTKLTDIPGASEALPHSTKQLYGYDGRLYSGEKYIIERIDTVHLEVDVEAMVKIIHESSWPTKFEEAIEIDRNTAYEAANGLANQLTKWARLVRE